MTYKTVHDGCMDLTNEQRNVVRVARIEFGPDADADKGVVYYTTGVKHLVYVPANTVILDAKCRTITAFATGQAVIVGDTSQSDGLFTTAKVAPTSAVTTGILKANSVSDYFNATGFLGGYSVPGARYINVTQSATGATKLSTSSTGKIELFLVYAICGDE